MLALAGLDASARAHVVGHDAYASSALVLAVANGATPPAPPSLLRPGLLDPTTRVGANLSLTETLEALGGPMKPSVGSALAPLPPADPAVRAKATRLYVQGRAALLENQLLIAATKLDEALGLDPGSPEILATYARLLSRMGNSVKANALYERLLASDPGRPEALLTIGLQAASRGEVDGTIRCLAPLLVSPPATDAGKVTARAMEEFWGSLREDALLAVELSLARALNESGADAAVLEILDRAFARTTPALTGWPGIECRRMAGDARARAGDVVGALRDWSEALKAIEASEPHDIALPPIAARVLWATRTIAIDGEKNQPATAPAQPDPSIALLKRLIAAGGPRDEWIALASWLASTTVAGTPADDELRAFASSVDVRIGDPRSARLAAALAPARAFERLAASHDRRHPDRAHIAAWLAAAAQQSPERVIEIAATLLSDTAIEPDLVISGLLSCGLDAPTLLERVAAPLPGGAIDPRRVALRVRLLARYERTGDAWRVASEARAAKGDDPAIIRALIVAATAAKRAEAIPELAERVRPDDVAGQIDILRAWVTLGSTDKAREASERADSAAGENERARAIARGLFASAMAADAARARNRERVDEALDALRVAVAADRTYELGWAQLLSITRALHPSDPRKGPSEEEKALRKELEEALPDSTLVFMLARESLISQGRNGDALEAIIARAASAPWEESLLRDSISAMAGGGRVTESLAMLDERIAVAPADPLAWHLWTEATIAAGHADEALERLSRGDDQRDDPIEDRLRALPLRALGRVAEAEAAEEAELDRQAPSVRRDIARIAKFIDGGRSAEALTALHALADRRADLTAQESFAGLELSIRSAPGDDRDGLVRTFAQDLLSRAERPETAGGMEPAAIVRAAGALALVHRGPEGEAERAALATRAVAAQAKAAAAMDPQAASVWLDLVGHFADERRFAEGSDFLGALVRSEVRMSAAVSAKLAMACFALDAAAGGRAAKSMALLDLVRSRGTRPFAGRQRVVERDSDELYLLAGVYSLVDDWKGNREILAESLARDPKHAMSMNNLAWDRLERDPESPEGIAEITRMIEAAHAALPADASILDSIGWLRYKQGAFAEAVDLLGKAITAGGDDPSLEALDHFGDAVWRSGNRDAARNAWREVAERGARLYPRETIVGRLPTYELNEHGVRVLDGEALWRRSYGEVIDRAAAKRKAAEAGGEPAVAPVFGGRRSGEDSK